MLAPRDLQHDFFDMLMESQYWSPEQLVAYQREQLEHLLRHAKANAPFYETRLDVLFSPFGTIDWEQWSRVPIVTRNDLLEHREAMLARTVPPGQGEARDFATSGSSGQPVTVRANGIAALANRAAEFRAFDWHSIDYAKNLCTFTSDRGEAMWPEGRRIGPWGPPWASGASAGRHVQINTYETNAHILDYLGQSESEYLIAVPLAAYSLALEAERLGSEAALDKIMYYGSAPSPAGDDACRGVFGADFLTRYSSKESNGIGHTCSTGTHYHVHAEIILVEVLDEAGRPCAEGQTGRIVVTPFFSTHQPLIRYELGDLVALGGRCSCGRTLPVLREVSGRAGHIFRFPDGSTSYRRLPQAMRRQLKCGLWQVAQVAPLELELRYVPLDWNDIGDEAGVAAFVGSVYHPDARVSMKRVDTIPLTTAGKLIEYSYEVPG